MALLRAIFVRRTMNKQSYCSEKTGIRARTERCCECLARPDRLGIRPAALISLAGSRWCGGRRRVKPRGSHEQGKIKWQSEARESAGKAVRKGKTSQERSGTRSRERGRRWLEELVTGHIVSADQIASREKCSVRQVNRIITLAFLAPDLVQAAVEGRLPRGIGVEALSDCPIEWRQQRQMLRLA